MRTAEFIKIVVVVSLLFILVACGGGGGDGVVADLPTGADVSSPKLISQMPSVDSSASIDVVVSMSFDEDLDPASITDQTIQVDGPAGSVAGTVTYDPSLKQLSFIPDSYLMAFSSYQVAFTGLTDLSGNVVVQSQDWAFTTIFDQLPPELPEF